ncbi:NUDIX domain-containing protein [Paracoccus sp. NGMCC 1.201697]|uniref:ADP-ribose pyrophosphatase n=1 Tax=Paracoccus broussonetiae subsp. drimophilus TaxID=3373869 RepID=A0ABW7LJT1_9RHOB
MPVLTGPLADPSLRERLAPQATATAPLNGRLVGGALAGIAAEGFPAFLPGGSELPAWETPWTPDLSRYAEIFALVPRQLDGREVLGIGDDRGEGAWQPQLAAAIADWLLTRQQDRSAADIRRRLPLIAGWIASRLRAGIETADLPRLGPDGEERVRLTGWSEPYADHFSVESLVLRQRRHRGDWSPDMLRAIFVSGDATVVLPWDPVRDHVLLIDQFRPGPVARGDRQPWFYETVAGRVDAGETPEQAALRESIEETGITLDRLIPGPHHYSSPGAMAEFLYLYVGIADLPDDAAGFGGLASEDEDIRSHVVPRVELTRMAMAGEIRNGPLLSLALWLEIGAARIRAELGLPVAG